MPVPSARFYLAVRRIPGHAMQAALKEQTARANVLVNARVQLEAGPAAERAQDRTRAKAAATDE